MILSIVTVVKGDLNGLVATCQSIDRYISDGDFEHLIWWNSEHQLTEQAIPQSKYRSIIQSSDSGIFDAMNRALRLCKGKYVLFLNANDTFEEIFTVSELSNCSGPGLIEVKYINYFGFERRVSVSKTVKMGIPYCHQGMVLERDKLSFPTNRKFGGDYVALLNCNYAWPIRILRTGSIRYDTSGVSSVNRWRSDMDTNTIIKERFGIFWQALHFFRSASKIIIKAIFDRMKWK